MNIFTSRTVYLIFFGTTSVFLWSTLFFLSPDQGNAPQELVSVVQDIPQNPFELVSLRASSVYVWDVKEQRPLLFQNEEIQLPLASLAKVMTALLAKEELPADASVLIHKEAVAQEGDQGLRLGERWDLKSLIDLTLVASSNDGAHALAQAVQALKTEEEHENISFAERMNEKVRSIGLQQTFFINESGLDVHEVVSGAYGSAKDIALLLEYAFLKHSDLFEATGNARYEGFSLDGKKHTVKNTNDFVETIHGIVASKTGFTDLAGGNLAVVFEIAPMHPIVAVVLGSTEEERFSDVEQLVNATTGYFSQPE